MQTVRRTFAGLAVAALSSALMLVLILALAPQAQRPAHAAQPVIGPWTMKAGSGGVTKGLIMKLSAANTVIKATAATDKLVGICEETASANAQTRVALAGTITTVTSGDVIAVGDCLTTDSASKAVAVTTGSASSDRVIAVALSAAGAADVDVTCLVTYGYVTVYPTYARGSNTVAADALAIPVTKAYVAKTTGADAEALTLANGTPGQILTISLVVDGGGDGTLTPTTKSGFTTITFADAGDTVTLWYVDDTVGWVIIGAAGVAAPPVIAIT